MENSFLYHNYIILNYIIVVIFFMARKSGKYNISDFGYFYDIVYNSKVKQDADIQLGRAWHLYHFNVLSYQEMIMIRNRYFQKWFP